MIGDLRIRTVHSGGAYTPTGAVAEAKRRGLSFIGITDLDSTAAVPAAVAAGLRLGVSVVPGIEIRTRTSSGKTVSILGYNLEPGPEGLGAVSDAAAAIASIHAAGGAAVAGYPLSPDAPAMQELIEAGVDGIEVNRAEYDPRTRRRLEEMAREYKLFATGGSDDGGEVGRTVRMGDVTAPDGAFEAITRPRDDELAWAEALVREAGAVARRALADRPGESDVNLKGGRVYDLVTEHDLAIEELIVGRVRERFPGHGFLTEENEHADIGADEPVWIVDPIDGTANFVATGRDFAISLAHYHGNRPRFGLVYDVMADQLYSAREGDGAWINGVRLPRIWGGERRELGSCVVECSLNAAHTLETRLGAATRPLATRFRAQRAYGSAAIGICRVAAGSLDVYISSSLSPWDYAAAAIVLAEAGGTLLVDVDRAMPDGALRRPWIAYPLEATSSPVIASGNEETLRAVHDALFSGDT
ncbi:MAG: inositol monophosphatase family protein [Spirochaetota bacterium]